MSTELSIVWLKGEIKTPPFSQTARIEAGFLLRKIQQGELIEYPQSSFMTVIGSNCHELRIQDKNTTWRIFYFIDTENHALVILEVLAKKTQKTPKSVIDNCKKRLKEYLEAIK